MAAYLLQNLPQRITDSNGDLCSGALLYTFVSGTTTPKTAYRDKAATISHPNPVQGDAAGTFPPIWLSPDQTYRIKVTKQDGTTIFTWDDISGIGGADLLIDLGSTTDAALGPALMGFNFQLNYAVNTIGWALKNAEGANPLWFGAVGDGIADDRVAVQAALDYAKTAKIPAGKVFLCKSGLAMNQAQQRIIGDGFGSEIRFALTTPGVGLTTSNSSGQQLIYGVKLNGASNTTKTVSVGSPQLTIQNSFIYNSTTTGHCVYGEDENVGSNIYAFGLNLLNNIIQGPGPANLNTYGVRLGLNHQTTRIIGGAITNCSTLVFINGATTQTIIDGTILQNCADTEQAIYINRTGSGMPCYEIDIRAYFEQTHRCIVVGDCDASGLNIHNCVANRNTSSSKATSYFYLAAGGTAATTQNICIDHNYVSDYGVFLGLGDEYGSRIKSARGNTTSSVTSYSSGAFANNAYDIRTVPFSFGYFVESGAPVVSNSVSRLEGKNGTLSVSFPLSTREKVAKIEFTTVSTLSNGVTVNFVKSPVTNVGSPSTVGTASSGGVTGTYTLSGTDYAAEDGYAFSMQAVFNNTGTSSYLYPAKVYLYK